MNGLQTLPEPHGINGLCALSRGRSVFAWRSTMSDEMSDAVENVRRHVHKILAQLRALKQQQREQPSPSRPDIAVEIDGEEDLSSSVGSGEGPS